MKSVQLPTPPKSQVSTSSVEVTFVSTSQTTGTSLIMIQQSSPESMMASKPRQFSGSTRLTRRYSGVSQLVLCSLHIGTIGRAVWTVQPIGSQQLRCSAQPTSGSLMACIALRQRWAASKAWLPNKASNISKEPTTHTSRNWQMRLKHLTIW